ncbi:hypothetical protein AB0368_13595 [Actinoplanes sp. NPDC051475]|uniref:hypothetical protein n=1 Tax=Actinoplanes sp. NPDC051475 TaxID=3157225 RepID=UPI00344C1FE7
MKSASRHRPSTAPIALLTAAGLIFLSLTLVIPTSDETVSSADQSVVSHTDAGPTALAIVLLCGAVLSFAGAGWKTYRRIRHR